MIPQKCVGFSELKLPNFFGHHFEVSLFFLRNVSSLSSKYETEWEFGMNKNEQE